MDKKEYFELYKDPRWQKLRLEILERDEWTCKNCNNKKGTLHVHHKYYEKNKKPWEYNNKSLVTLCNDCHESEGKNSKFNEKIFREAFYCAGFLSEHFFIIGYGFYNMKMKK